MIKVFGIEGCPYCAYVKPQLDSRFEYIEINHVQALHEFIELRDTRKEFDRMKAMDDLGLPCFVNEDGSVSFSPEDYGLISYTGKSSCSLSNKGNC